MNDLPPAPPEGPWDAPEIAVRTFRVALLYFEKHYGRDRLEQVWRDASMPLSLAFVEELSNFASVRFLERLYDVLTAASGDPEFVRKAGMHLATPEALGFAFYMLRGFGSPRTAYKQTLALGPSYNRVGAFEVDHLGVNELRFSYRSEVKEHDRKLCITRMANFAAFPTIWRLPPAEIKELQCQVNGADCCRYELRWKLPPPAAWRKVAGGAVGVAVGALAVKEGWTNPEVGFGALAAAGAFVGAWLDVRKLWRVREAELAEQTTGFMDSLSELQKRSDEVFRANVELEARVEDRTRELIDSNEKLCEVLERQREIDRQKTQFFDNVSHELRTPLTLILLTLESLQQHPRLDASARQHLDRMERSASRLARLINELLDLAKIGAGQMRLAYQPVDVREMVAALLIPFRVLAEEKKLALRLEAEEPVEAVHADPEKLDLVFQNLVANALKFTSAGEVAVKVWQDAFYVYASVRDTGVGISAADQEIIFNRFAQADAEGTRRLGGTGLGLALVKETVELHGGNVTVESQLGRGSTFTVALPRGTLHIREYLRETHPVAFKESGLRRIDDQVRLKQQQRRRLAALGGEEPQAPGETGPEPLPNRPTLLVVEDDAEIRAFVNEVLREEYAVIEAADGEAGLNLARERTPALIVSDVMMPRMSGLQMLAALREDPRTVDIPVILLTARHDVDARVHGLGEGANDYLGKPFAPRELLARIDAQLRLRDAAARIAQTERLAATSLLTSGFAHEVRNPLNGLMNAILPLKEWVASGGDPGLATSMLEVIEESGRRIRHLAESLLAMVKTQPERARVDVADTLAAAERALRWKLPEGVELEHRLESRGTVRADAAALTQVWVNLLDNALRALRPRGHVRITTRQVKDEVVVTIQDDGCGIPPEAQARLFEPFFSTRSAGDGTGLGLALCRRIVVAHEGRIDVRSQPGEGTEVEVRLPAAEAGADPLRPSA